MRRWRCIRRDEGQKLTVGKIYKTDDDEMNLINDSGEIHSRNVKITEYDFSKFEEVFTFDSFTKSDLEECDVVYTRDRDRLVYFDESIFKCDNAIPMHISIYNYYDDLTHINCKCCDIMEVYRNKQLIYKREEKSASQLKVEELEKTIAKAMEQIDEIKKENGYDN